MSNTTGIIFNNEMDDFSSPNITNGFELPPSKKNFIKPNKRPLSSMAPTIVVDKNSNVSLIIGAAGGSKITTTVASILLLNLIYGYNIKEATNTARFHHQLMPMKVKAEKNCSREILVALEEMGHDIEIVEKIDSSVTSIQKRNHDILACTDYRRLGSIDGL